MHDIPYEDAIHRIQEESGLSLAEIQSRIDAKLQQLSGLVSKDGAAHILANELGIQLAKPAPEVGAELKISDVRLGARNISVVGRVVQKYDPKSFNKNGREGRVASLLLGDDTGVIRVTFWNDQVDAFNELVQGDVLVVRNPFVKPAYQQDRLELQLNTQSTIIVNPEGVVVAQRDMPQRAPATQKYIRDLKDTDENVELIATIVQVYDPRFFDSCPKCNKKLISDNQCAEHGEVVGSMNCSMNAVLDDGTGTIRATFWKQQALRLTKSDEPAFARFREDPTSFEDVKNDLLGEFLKVVGKVRRNEQQDRLELTAQLVTLDVDPAKELEGLQRKFESSPAVAVQKVQAAIEKKEADESGMSVVEDDVVSLDDL